MAKYIASKMVMALVALFVTSVVIFLCLHLLPGDMASIIGGNNASAEDLERIRVQLGLNQPLLLQYRDWLLKFVTGDLGHSSLTGLSISDEVVKKASVTFPLCLLSLLIAVVLGVLGGLLTGYKQRSSRIFLLVSSTPGIWLGLIFIEVLGKGMGVLNLLPTSGAVMTTGALIMPALVCGVISGARLYRLTVAAVSNSEDDDYVLNYAAQGFSRRYATYKSGVRSRITPIISSTVLTGAEMITGVVMLEKLFVLPGIGSMLVTDVMRRDIFKVQSELLLFVILIISIGFVLDIILGLVDPRVRQNLEQNRRWHYFGF
ncbi:MAG: ABC transporter permease [Candidatus Ancillula trichonymphae]|nr:ABC transporter permease [Candidatus Ancillula trichonymphae]